jgi:hypothetical protein
MDSTTRVSNARDLFCFQGLAAHVRRCTGRMAWIRPVYIRVFVILLQLVIFLLDDTYVRDVIRWNNSLEWKL